MAGGTTHTGGGAAARQVNGLAEARRRLVAAKLAQLTLLPTSLAVPMRVLKLQKMPGVGMPQLAGAIAADPGLVGKILAVANSAAFSPARPVMRLSQAVAMIGLKNLMPLVFGLSLAGIFNELALPASERDALWRSSLLKAVAAREICALLSPDQAEEAFLAALLQDVALPVLYAADRSAWGELLGVLDHNLAERREREARLFGADHAAWGGLLVGRLGVPEAYATAVARHHDATGLATGAGDEGGGTAGPDAAPDAAAAFPAPVRSALTLAAALPHQPSGSAGRVVPIIANRLRALLPPAPDADAQVKRVLRSISSGYAALISTFGDTADEQGLAFREFLQSLCAEVAQCMVGAIGESAATIAGLRNRESELLGVLRDLRQQIQQVEYDPLTGTLARAAFASRAGALLGRAAQNAVPCNVGFVDLDDFKSINDRYGHDVGDRALQEVGRRLTAALRTRGLIGRVGGDEFAFACLAPDGPTPGQEASRLADALDGLSVPLDDGRTAEFSTSVGLVALGVPRPDDTLAEALRAADHLMYSAKKSGKARCVAALYERPSRAA